ncbi:MAG: VWA domain-containing protein [Blastocatellia bacterium]|nr:VWA domain-containing protein [Blastocatellia bacterium]
MSQTGNPDQPIDISGEVLKIDTGLVSLDVTVVDQSNIPVYDLSKENFAITEDKIPQVIESVDREETPISFGIVMDASGSMRSKLSAVTVSAHDLLKEMKPEDEGFVAQFQYQTELIQPFTLDKSKLDQALDTIVPDGGTAMLDAIINTSEYVTKKGKLRRKALIIISDGVEKNSLSRENEVMDAIKESDAQVYLIGFIPDEEGSSPLSVDANLKARALLTRLADESGGRAFFPRNIHEMDEIAKQISKDLRSQYTINYYPTNERKDGSYRKIKVTVTTPDNRKLIARTRLGYTAKTEGTTEATRTP